MTRLHRSLVCVITACFILTSCSQDNPPVVAETEAELTKDKTSARQNTPPQVEQPKPISTANAVAKLNRVINKTLHKKQLPDFSQYKNVKQKKLAFFSFLRPLIDQANGQVLRLREELNLIDPERINSRQEQRLAQLARTYKINTTEPTEQLQLLLRKVQIIPASLVLAQAANESAWGTSRFAQEGNNLFGQWCFSAGCGLVPSGRPANETYEVRLFKTPLDSVTAYVRNLNSHGGYISLRRIRECIIAEEEDITGRALASGLLHYSSRGVEYIKEIRQMIRINKLEPWEQNWWGEMQPDHACYQLVQTPETQIETDVVATTADNTVAVTQTM